MPLNAIRTNLKRKQYIKPVFILILFPTFLNIGAAYATQPLIFKNSWKFDEIRAIFGTLEKLWQMDYEYQIYAPILEWRCRLFKTEVNKL